jgi:hypothetical protein
MEGLPPCDNPFSSEFYSSPAQTIFDFAASADFCHVRDGEACALSYFYAGGLW